MPTRKGKAPLYLTSREIPDKEILNKVKKGIEQKKSMNQIARDNGLSNSLVSRYFWQIQKRRW